MSHLARAKRAEGIESVSDSLLSFRSRDNDYFIPADPDFPYIPPARSVATSSSFSLRGLSRGGRNVVLDSRVNSNVQSRLRFPFRSLVPVSIFRFPRPPRRSVPAREFASHFNGIPPLSSSGSVASISGKLIRAGHARRRRRSSHLRASSISGERVQ